MTNDKCAAAFREALRNVRAYEAAARSAELQDKRYRAFDGRGYHAVSLEVGRILALVELCPELGEDLDLQEVRRAARDTATAAWLARHLDSPEANT